MAVALRLSDVCLWKKVKLIYSPEMYFRNQIQIKEHLSCLPSPRERGVTDSQSGPNTPFVRWLFQSWLDTLTRRWWTPNKTLAVAEWVSAPDWTRSPAGKLLTATRKRAEKWLSGSLEWLLPVIVPLPSRTLTPFQTIGGAAATIQWCFCDVETFASWRGEK